MSKAGRRKWYAVRTGWDGPRIYDSWEETKKSVLRFRGAQFKSFLSRAQAEEWLEEFRKHSLPPELVGQSDTPAVLDIRTTSLDGEAMPLDDKDAEMSDASNAEPNSSDSSTLTPGDASPAVEPADPPSKSEVKLSPEQQHVLNLVKSDTSVFFTGSAGTGKSILLRAIIQWCKDEGLNHAVTASTGIAAVNIGGCTLHSWAGIALGKETAEKLVGKILGQDKRYRLQAVNGEDSDGDEGSKPRVVKRWRQCKILIIDEISMVDGKLFDKLEYIGRALRKNNRPFGGIQLVLSGDFCQLPPVPDTDKCVQIPATFAFDAKSWDSCVGKPVVLKKVFRQKDQHFVDMLNAMRFGSLSAEIIKSFRELSRPVEYADGLEPTDLFPTRNEVQTANSNRLKSIQSEPYEYKALDVPGFDVNGRRISPEQLKRLLDRLVAPECITLKVGAQVMLIKNLVQGVLVNGSLGRVVEFLTTRQAAERGIQVGVPDVEAKRWQGEEKARVNSQQIPPGILRSPRKWPVVLFHPVDIGPRTMCCIPCSFEVNNAEGEIEARRDQVPLILAWALSVHKSQGQTLERVRVDLSRTFEKGQAYVALSRATNMDTLQVKGFDPLKVQAHPRVIEWTRANTDIDIRQHSIDDDAEYWDHF